MADTVVQIIIRAKNEASSGFNEAGASLQKFVTQWGTAAGIAQGVTTKLIDGIATGAQDAARLIVEIPRALLDMAKAAAAAGDEALAASQKTGLSVEEFSAFKLAADQSEVSVEALSVGLRFMQKNMVEVGDATEGAAGDSNKAQKAFHELGVTTTDASGKFKTTKEILLDLADVFSKMPDGPVKTQAAIAVLGRSGSNLIPFLNQGREGIEALVDAAVNMQAVMSTGAAVAVDSFGDRIKLLNAQVEELQVRLVAAMIPALDQVADDISRVVAQTSIWIEQNQKQIDNVSRQAANDIELAGAIAQATAKQDAWINSVIRSTPYVGPFVTGLQQMAEGFNALANARAGAAATGPEIPHLNPFDNKDLQSSIDQLDKLKAAREALIAQHQGEGPLLTTHAQANIEVGPGFSASADAVSGFDSKMRALTNDIQIQEATVARLKKQQQDLAGTATTAGDAEKSIGDKALQTASNIEKLISERDALQAKFVRMDTPGFDAAAAKIDDLTQKIIDQQQQLDLLKSQGADVTKSYTEQARALDDLQGAQLGAAAAAKIQADASAKSSKQVADDAAKAKKALLDAAANIEAIPDPFLQVNPSIVAFLRSAGLADDEIVAFTQHMQLAGDDATALFVGMHAGWAAFEKDTQDASAGLLIAEGTLQALRDGVNGVGDAFGDLGASLILTGQASKNFGQQIHDALQRMIADEIAAIAKTYLLKAAIESLHGLSSIAGGIGGLVGGAIGFIGGLFAQGGSVHTTSAQMAGGGYVEDRSHRHYMASGGSFGLMPRAAGGLTVPGVVSKQDNVMIGVSGGEAIVLPTIDGRTPESLLRDVVQLQQNLSLILRNQLNGGNGGGDRVTNVNITTQNASSFRDDLRRGPLRDEMDYYDELRR